MTQKHDLTMKRQLTTKQHGVLELLQRNFALSDGELERVLFLNERDKTEPWIPADLQEAIARQVGTFKHISVTHDKFINERQQVIYTATVIDTADRSYTRTGAAIIGEAPNGVEMDVDVLAASRALNAALNAAGFNPFKAGSVVNIAEARESLQAKPLNPTEQQLHAVEDEATARRTDLARIHALAVEKGLTVGKDDSRYRDELFEHYGVRTAAILNRTERAAVVNWLTNYKRDDFLQSVPVELQGDALIA
jgi:hypothetical protein